MQISKIGEKQAVGVVGGGAIGLWIAGRLAHAGHDVSLLTRGKTLQAVNQKGILIEGPTSETYSAQVRVSNDASDLGQQDVLVFAVKGQALSKAASDAHTLIGPQTIILPAMNGVPWWFMAEAPGEFGGVELTSVDPSGLCSRLLPVVQTIGCVVHASTKVLAPGYIKHVMGDGLIFGAVTPAMSNKLSAVAETFEQSGFNVTLSADIRKDIWYKLWGNMTMNPLSAITGATCDRILDDIDLRSFTTVIMNEAAAIGERIGCQISDSPEARHEITRRLGAFKTSMLQDAEAGKPLEIDSLLAAPQEIARLVGVSTPNLDHLLGIMRVYSEVRQG